MQRDPRKPWGGMWEATAGGSALAGETPLECAARELREEIETAEEEIREELERQHKGTARELSGRSYLFDGVPEDVAGLLEEIRLGNSFSQGQKTGKK